MLVKMRSFLISRGYATDIPNEPQNLNCAGAVSLDNSLASYKLTGILQNDMLEQNAECCSATDPQIAIKFYQPSCSNLAKKYDFFT